MKAEPVSSVKEQPTPDETLNGGGFKVDKMRHL
jgi:hypothetical protein